MNRFLEIILGLSRGFLSREGDFSLSFDPAWPAQNVLGASTWNALLIALSIALVIVVYRHEGRTRGVRIFLGVTRALLLALIIAILNRPVLTLGQSYSEPSVLAVMIDDSLSMRIRDAALDPKADPEARLSAAIELLSEDDQKLLKDLAKKHQLRFYRFDTTAVPIDNAAIAKLEPSGQSTQLGESLRAALDDLQGQRLAGIVLLTDGRDAPSRPISSTIAQLKDSGVKIFPVALGADSPPMNIEVQSVSAQDAAFKDDIVNIRATVRAAGVGASGRPVTIRLKDKKSDATLTGSGGTPVEQKITLADDTPTEVELQFKPQDVGPLDLVVEAVKQPGEIDEDDNTREVQMEVLDAKIAVLYVEGYPRWEYRYIKNEMIRDKSVDIACLLTSADPNFLQEGDKHIVAFPESMEELLNYDVVIFGDVDPIQFSDAQLQLVNEFVSKKSGGFGMIAGPQFSPQGYRGTPIEQILPVDVAQVKTEETHGAITHGFRPVLTKEGEASSIFRFFPDKLRNEKYLKEDIQPLFWYCRGVRVKRGVGEVVAEHPVETDPDGRKAPLLVLGHYGSGRTLFSAIDDSWRWRYYTGESVFDTYWVQQLRYLARSKKLGQRRLTFVASRPVYELGQQVRSTLRVLDPQIIPQLPEQVRVEVQDGNGQTIRQEMLVKQEGAGDTYNLSFTAERAGRFVIKLPALAGGADAIDLPIDVTVPKLELSEPQVNRVALAQLAGETRDLKEETKLLDGQQSTAVIEPANARIVLPKIITSAARVRLVETPQPLWDAPLAMILFVFLITVEWLGRKVYGML